MSDSFAIQCIGALNEICAGEGLSMDRYGIAAFRSRQQVFKYEEIFARGGIATQVVSTPREIAAGCGLSLRFSMSDLPKVQATFAHSHPTNLIGLYAIERREDGRTILTTISR